jgi:type IV pilus assembly protein PilN
MLEVNFLTQEYKLKLKLEKLFKNVLTVVLIIFLIEFSGFLVFKGLIKNVEGKIAIEKKVKQNFNKTKTEYVEKSKALPDLTNKIQIVEDIFAQQNLRFSEILYSINKKTPDNIWYTNLRYDKNVVSLKGVSYYNPLLNLSSEKNIYFLESSLNESGKYERIRVDFIKLEKQEENKVNKFEVNLQLKE